MHDFSFAKGVWEGRRGREERRFRRSRDSGFSHQQEAPIRNRAFRHKNCQRLADIVHFDGFCATLVAGWGRQASKDGARHSIPQLESARRPKAEAIELRKSASRLEEERKWLGYQDSNLDSWHQKPESCRWTIPQRQRTCWRTRGPSASEKNASSTSTPGEQHPGRRIDGGP